MGKDDFCHDGFVLVQDDHVGGGRAAVNAGEVAVGWHGVVSFLGGGEALGEGFQPGAQLLPALGGAVGFDFQQGVRGAAPPRTQSRSSHRIAGCGRPPPPALGCCRGPGGRVWSVIRMQGAWPSRFRA